MPKAQGDVSKAMTRLWGQLYKYLRNWARKEKVGGSRRWWVGIGSVQSLQLSSYVYLPAPRGPATTQTNSAAKNGPGEETQGCAYHQEEERGTGQKSWVAEPL